MDLKKMTVVTKEELVYLKHLQESLCFEIETVWKSKYNSYVVYDYEPFCSDGFEIFAKFTGDVGIVKYVKYLLEKRREEVEYLENILTCGVC